VTVDTSTVDGTDADLKIALSGSGFLGNTTTGRKMPFRLLGPVSDDNLPVVVVFGAGGTHAEQKIPFVRVKDCDADPFITVGAQSIPESGPDIFRLEATSGTETLSDAKWEFGDGQRVSTPEPQVTHDYGTRPQTGRFSEFLITVTAKDSQGRTLGGSFTMELLNRRYLEFKKGS
jgi:hypothetical protein